MLRTTGFGSRDDSCAGGEVLRVACKRHLPRELTGCGKGLAADKRRSTPIKDKGIIRADCILLDHSITIFSESGQQRSFGFKVQIADGCEGYQSPVPLDQHHCVWDGAVVDEGLHTGGNAGHALGSMPA